MSDGIIDIDALGVTGLSPCDIAGLGDSALGHAVRRLLALRNAGCDADAADTIAAHDSHV